jgi:hypothetical protein
MPLHDFRCPNCGSVKRDLYLPISVRASEALIACLRCRPSLPFREDGADHSGKFLSMMEWIPQVGRMDAGSGSAFTTFTTQVRQPDGSYRPTVIDSVHKLRQVEKATEQAARNGEGEAMRFRMWSHTDSNGDVNSFGDDPSVQAQKDLAALQEEAGDRRRGRLTTIRGDQARKNAETLGPGVTEDTASVFSLG